LFYKDCQGRYLGCNLAFEQFIGSQKEEIIGKSVYDLSPKALADIYYAADKALFDKTGVQTYEAKAQSADGQQRDVLFYKATFDKPDGSLGGLVGIILDITERKQLEKGLKERELLYHTVADYTSDWEYWIMPDGTFRYVSISCEQISGYSPDEFYADPKLLVQIIHPNDKHLYTGHVHHVLSQGVSEPLDFRIHTKGGECRWISHVCQAVYDPAGQLLGQRASNRDITARKLAEQALAESESRSREIFDTVNDAIFIQDAETGRVIDVNLRMQEMYGYSREEALALGPDDMGIGMAPYSSVEVIEKIRLAQTEGPQVFDWLSRTREGHFFWVEVSLRFALIGKQGRILAVVRDITKQKDAEARIHHLAYYDSLTDLPNRTLFSDRLQQALAVAKRDKSCMAMMFIDLDRFKTVNDTLGHHVGDMLLREAAKRMKDCVRESDTVARIGGDEFGVVLQIVNPEQDAMLVAEKIRHALNQPFMLVGKSLHISSSIGIAIYPDHGDDAKQLLRNADLAMYHAKEDGRNNVKCYQ
jgi:diguanylate cyclase (GGDEF)-like protein/PAS domain S-box-containing protein